MPGNLFSMSYQFFQFFFIVHIHSHIAVEETFFGFDGHGGDIDPQFTGDEVGDLMDHAHIIEAYDLETSEEGDLFVLRPFCFYDTMAIIAEQLGGIGTIGAVDGKAFARGYKTEYVITRNGFAAIGERIDDLVAAFSEDDELGIFAGLRCRWCWFPVYAPQVWRAWVVPVYRRGPGSPASSFRSMALMEIW